MAKTREVPFFDYKYVFYSHEKEIVSIIKKVGNRGAFIMQTELLNFENKLAKFLRAKYAIGVSNATDGLQMSLMAGGINCGDEIIFCTHTMVATASAIHFSGAIPIPVEAGKDHLIDISAIEKAITKKTKAILITQLNGRTANMEKLTYIAKKNGLQIYEDAAQALGSKFKEQFAGTFGVASVISFYPAKNLGCLGDGGAVVTNSKKVYDTVLLLRDHGRDQNGDCITWGFNSRLDNIQAAILEFKLGEYEKVILRRREIARTYQRRLKDLNTIVLPPGPEDNIDHLDVYQNYEIEANNRDKLKSYLYENGVGTLIQWGGKGVHQFRSLGFTQNLPISERMFERMLMLPMNMSLTDDDVEYVCKVIRRFYHGG